MLTVYVKLETRIIFYRCFLSVKVLVPFKDNRQQLLISELVYNEGRTWMKVIARNAQALHLIWKVKFSLDSIVQLTHNNFLLGKRPLWTTKYSHINATVS